MHTATGTLPTVNRLRARDKPYTGGARRAPKQQPNPPRALPSRLSGITGISRAEPLAG
jgi:hypothetical protein